MQLVDVAAEQTTAATDVLLALVALAGVVWLARTSELERWKARIWSWALGLLALASGMGAIAHGLKMPQQTNSLLWQPLDLALGMTVAMFVVGVVNDMWGEVVSRQVLPILVGVGMAFFAVTVLIPGSFLVFDLYEGVGMLFALVVYSLLAIRRRLAGAAVMATGILITIVAAAVQTSDTVHLRVIWEFDHNGVFHLIQVVGVVMLLAGLRVAPRDRASAST